MKESNGDGLRVFRGSQIDPQTERDRQIRQSIEILNHLLATSARPQSVHLLRKILRERAEARVKWGQDKNSLPGLF